MLKRRRRSADTATAMRNQANSLAARYARVAFNASGIGFAVYAILRILVTL